jgi:hypothetical protein
VSRALQRHVITPDGRVVDHPPRYLVWVGGPGRSVVRAGCDCHFWEPVRVAGRAR